MAEVPRRDQEHQRPATPRQGNEGEVLGEGQNAQPAVLLEGVTPIRVRVDDDRLIRLARQDRPEVIRRLIRRDVRLES